MTRAGKGILAGDKDGLEPLKLDELEFGEGVLRREDEFLVWKDGLLSKALFCMLLFSVVAQDGE